jgi:hypothetical protein
MSEKIYEDKIEQDLISAIYAKLGTWRKVEQCIEVCSGLKLSSALWFGLARGSRPFRKEAQNAVRACFPGWPSVLLDPVDIVERYSLHNAVVADEFPNTAILINIDDKNVTGITAQTVEHISHNHIKIQIELFLDSEHQGDSILERPLDILELHHTSRRCAYCGAAAPLTIDHVIPTSRGGADVKSNMVWCCFTCNVRKETRTPEEAEMPIIFIEESTIE